MHQGQENTSPRHHAIPHINCPKCQTGMRLSFVEPAVVSTFRVETLVFECTCGFACKVPADAKSTTGL